MAVLRIRELELHRCVRIHKLRRIYYIPELGTLLLNLNRKFTSRGKDQGDRAVAWRKKRLSKGRNTREFHEDT